MSTENTNHAQERAEILAEALPYIRKYAGATIVIKYGGNAMTDAALKEGFAKDVVLLKLCGMNPIVVHGGGPQINHMLEKVGKQGEVVQGKKLFINTPDKNGVDIGQVGTVDSIDGTLISGLADKGYIPVIAPIGVGRNGEAFNINADLVAGRLAKELMAERLIMMTNTPGILDKEGKLLTDLTPKLVDDLIADGTLSGGMLPKIASALDAATSGVKATIIIDGRVPHALLLELFTNAGVGSMILDA